MKSIIGNQAAGKGEKGFEDGPIIKI